MTTTGDDLLASARSAAEERATSPSRFDDGGQYRVEIPSVEGPAALDSVLQAADARGIVVHRVSQGSGIALLTDAEIAAMAALGASHTVEVCLFVGPKAPWNASASALTPDGAVFGWRHTSVETLQAAFDDVVRATELGIRSVLLSDEGLITAVAAARRAGTLPADLVVKSSAMLGTSNALGVRLIAGAGADTVNIASDMSIGDVAASRALTAAVLDVYVEGPDGLGGFMRYHDIGDLVRVGSPMHLKFGLRNASGIYPAGEHLESLVLTSARERVRRAEIGLEHLARQYPSAVPSTLDARPGIPQP
jgi:hypothetical protein